MCVFILWKSAVLVIGIRTYDIEANSVVSCSELGYRFLYFHDN
jgi:hypothetical protein